MTPIACGDLSAAVDAGEPRFLRVAAQSQRLVNNRGKILVRPDVNQLRVGYGLGGKHTVRVACLRRHEAVCGKEDRGGETREFLLLVLPRGAEVSLEVGVLFQLRVTVGGEHFAVGVDVDPLVFRLL